jgi:hypothetical protein
MNGTYGIGTKVVSFSLISSSITVFFSVLIKIPVPLQTMQLESILLVQKGQTLVLSVTVVVVFVFILSIILSFSSMSRII